MREERLRRQPPQGKPERRAPTRDFAELKAMALLRAARLERPPVDVDLCAQVAGIQLISRDEHMGKHSAILSVPYGIPSVAVNARHPIARQRFSLAHEIGHWVLERAPVTHDLAPVAARGREYTALERVCDYFATSLLMPRAWVRDRVALGMTAGEVARKFGVSSDAMYWRMRELGLATQRGRLR